MGEYNFDNIDLDFTQYDIIFCDKNYDVDLANIKKGGFREVKESILDNLDKDILYIVSGSPLFFSGALIILDFLRKRSIEFKIIDNTSSLNYMLSHNGISLMQTNSSPLETVREFMDTPRNKQSGSPCRSCPSIALRQSCA